MLVDVALVKTYIKPKATSTLRNMKKDALIEYIRTLEYNYNTAVSFNCRWIEKELGSIDHLRDLLQAEQEGRLVVLPCGTDVELVRDGHAFKADHWNHTLTAFRDAPENKSGKQVALFSIKEAEAALKGGEG